MKLSVALYSLVISPIFLLAGCYKQENNVDKNNNIQQEGNIKMANEKTNSGLEYQILNPGAGESPKAGQKVTVHYTGWLSDNGNTGPKFDSSVDRGVPFSFKIGAGEVIKGWDEGVMLMKVGEKRRLIIPAHLAYGSSSIGGVIPANATLIFDVELIKVGN